MAAGTKNILSEDMCCVSHNTIAFSFILASLLIASTFFPLYFNQIKAVGSAGTSKCPMLYFGKLGKYSITFTFSERDRKHLRLYTGYCFLVDCYCGVKPGFKSGGKVV